jgi:hypothetical protein
MDLLDNSMNTIKSETLICHHSIIDDYIDLDYGEKSLRISYCEKCLLDVSVIRQLCGTNLSVSSSSICTASR